MDVIQATRELGKAIQADERYSRLMQAQQDNDNDKVLQDKIADFNVKRTQLNNEVQKDDKDEEKIKNLNAELKAAYQDIFENPNMAAFSSARAEMQSLMEHVNAIISGSANGQDPETIDPASACGGSCASCAGCH